MFDKVDPKPSEPTGFFFASDNIATAEYLMIIIHGMGVLYEQVNGHESSFKKDFFSVIIVKFIYIYIHFVRLIMNVNLEVGSQIDYIQLAQAKGYAVIVTNTNLNTDESSKSLVSSSRPIRVSEEKFFFFL